MSDPFKTNTDVPEIQIVESTDPHHGAKLELQGWDRLDHWADRNHPLWRSTTQHLKSYAPHVTEIDQMRFLAATLLRQSVELLESVLDAAIKNPFPNPLIMPHSPHENRRHVGRVEPRRDGGDSIQGHQER